MSQILRFASLQLLVWLAAASPAGAQVDLSLSSSLAPSSVVAGETATLTITLTNPSNDNVDAVRKEVVLPAGVSYVSSSDGTYDAPSRTWSETSRIKKNRSDDFTLTVQADASGSHVLTATIASAAEPDPNAGNDSTAQTLQAATPPPVCYAVADAGGANGGNDWLVRLERDGSGQQAIGTGTGTNLIEAIAYWPGTETLYAANASTLGTLAHAGDGAYTRVGTVSFGTADGAEGVVTINDVDGLAVDPFTGALYGSHRREGSPNAEDLLVQIDPVTGTVVPDAFGAGVDYLVIASGVAPTSKLDIDDIAIDPVTGSLFAIANGGGTGDRLVTVDRATGVVTDVGALGVDDVEGLAFDATGGFFASTGTGGTTTTRNSVYSVDRTTGAATRLAGFATGTDHESTACLTDGTNTLSGTVFFDADANGSNGTGADAPHPGATVTLWRDLDGDGTGDVAVATAATDASGGYAFEVAAQGDFVVVVTDPSGGTGAFTTPDERTASLSGFGTAETLADVGFATSVDLELDMTVSTPTPAVGETVTFTVTLTNVGVVDATGVSVLNALEDVPGVVTVTGVTPSAGTFDGGLWTVGDLPAGGGPVTLTITAVVLQDEVAITNLAEIASADQTDVDSTPLDGSTAEDDDASATVTTGGSSSGGEGGLESDGSLALALARVQLDRRLGPAPVAAQPFNASAALARHMAAGKGGGTTLASVVPPTGPDGSVPVEVSPEDLLPVTNALDVVAVDYLAADGRRRAALFATTTAPGEIYEHTKPVCDRLRGSTLERIETHDIAGHPFVVSELHAGAAVDYAVSFVAYPQADGGWEIDSRFLLRDYVPQAVGDAVNVQVWSPSRAWTAALVEDALARLGGELRFLNTAADAPTLPRTYVRTARYRAGALEVEIVNGAGASEARLVGGTVAAVEGAERYSLEEAVALPEGAVVTVVVPTGPLFDAAFFVETDGGDGADRLYVADGAWSWAQGDAAVHAFDIAPETTTFDPAARPVERPAVLAGDVTTWAGLVRPLRPGYAPEDVSSYDALAFTARGEGTVQVLVETAGIATSDHWRAPVQLRPDATTHRIAFADLRRDAGGAFVGEDVVALSFYVYGDGETAAPFRVELSELRFESSAAAPPPETALLPARPNPLRGQAVIPFALAEPGRVTLEVFDLLGRRVALLADGEIAAGEHRVTFDARGVSAGVYVVRLRSGDAAFTRRVTVLR